MNNPIKNSKLIKLNSVHKVFCLTTKQRLIRNYWYSDSIVFEERLNRHIILETRKHLSSYFQ
jgi:hypothetical protein